MKRTDKTMERENIFIDIARMEERISRIKNNLNKIKQKSSEFKSRAFRITKS